MKNVKQYYKELGKLVYAIAIADGNIQPEEKDKLNSFVLKNLSHLEHETDTSGMNKAFYVDFEFDNSELMHIDTDLAVKSFSQYVNSNSEPGDEKLINQSVQLLEAVSDAFTEKKEKQIIKRVKGELKETLGV
jgi:hypothetical protein